MFNSRKTAASRITLNLTELTTKAEYLKLDEYVKDKGSVGGELKARDVKKYLLAKWTLDSIAQNNLKLYTLIKILEVAHLENKILEILCDEQNISQTLANICDADSKYPKTLSDLVKQRLSNESKSEGRLEVTKTGVITKSRLSQIIVDLHTLIKTADITFDLTDDLTNNLTNNSPRRLSFSSKSSN